MQTTGPMPDDPLRRIVRRAQPVPAQARDALANRAATQRY